MGNALPYTGSFKDDFGKTKEEQEQQNKETSMYSGSFEDDFGEKKKNVYKPPSARGVYDLADDNNFAVVGKYMDQRFGMTTKNHERQEIVDAYINNMRKFNFGQSVTTLGELSYLNAAKRDENSERLNTAASAYQLFDNMKGAFAEGTTGMQKLDAVYDYGRALIWDPVNLVSFGIGKLAAQGGLKVVNQSIKQMALESAKNILGTKALKNPKLLQETAIQQQRLIRPGVMKQLRGQEAIKEASKRDMLGTFGAETVASGLIDGAYQTSLRRVDLQDQHSWLQTGINAVAGAAAFGGIYGAMRYVSKKGARTGDNIGLAAKAFDGMAKEKADALALLGIDTTKINAKKMKELKANPDKFINDLKVSREAQEKWTQKVLNGSISRETAAGREITDDVSILNSFLFGELDETTGQGFKGIQQILEEYEIRMPQDRGGAVNFTDWLTNTIDELPKNAQDEINGIYRVTLGAIKDSSYTGKNFTGKGQGGEILAKEMSEWAKRGHTLAMLSKQLKQVADVTDEDVVMQAAKMHLDPALPEGAFTKGLLGAQGLQQSFIKALVTHPATVGLNVVGWQAASTLQSSADIVRGTLYGGASFFNKVAGRDVQAAEYANIGKLMMSLQRQKVMNLVDPRATMDEMLDYIAFNPKAGKELFRYISGGIEDDAVLRSLLDVGPLTEQTKKQIKEGFGQKSKVSRIDKVIDGFQTIYGVKAQDILTKSVEFMYNIDKQIRINHGVTYKEFISSPRLWEKMEIVDPKNPAAGWAAMQGAAVNDTLKSVYAKSYGKDLDSKSGVVKIIPFLAKGIEEMRRIPGIGALVPFGQFFNNTLAHMFDYTGISLIHKPFAKSSTSYMDLTTKAAIGLSVIGATATAQRKNVEEGLAWHEERISDGTVRSRLYDFPFSFYKAIGVLGVHVSNGDGVPKDLFKDIVTQFGPSGLLRGVGDVGKGMYAAFEELFTNENVDVSAALTKSIGGAVSMYASGLTRPLDPVNLVVGISRGEKYVERDKNQGTKSLNYSMRYLDQIFEGLGAPFPKLLGQEVPEEKNQPLTSEKGRAPIGRLFGFRESNRQSSMQKMFNEVGMPQWRTNIKSYVPKADNAFDGAISDIIESKAATLIDSPVWKTSSLTDRKYLISKILSGSKKEATQRLENSYSLEDNRMALLYKLTKRGGTVSKRNLQEYMADLNIEIPVEELTLKQLRLINSYAESDRKQQKDLNLYVN